MWKCDVNVGHDHDHDLVAHMDTVGNEENIDDSGMIPHDRDEMYALDALLPVLRDLARLVSSRLK
jgi:hypothetical protein